MHTKQIEFWSGNFGKEYTDRNPQNLEEWDNLYLSQYGILKTEMNEEFLGNLDKSSRILEIGCNIGLQLLGLQRQGFSNLYGIELQNYAVEKAKSITQAINIIQGSGLDIPFKDNYFDLVMTNGVLIHIAPKELPTVMKEMVRVTRKYIFGFEYFAEELIEIPYRGNQGFLWKGNYAEEFLKVDVSLAKVKDKLFSHTSNNDKGNKDIMYLLEKKS